MKRHFFAGGKRILKTAAALLAALLLTGAAGAASAESRLMVVSDMHYMARELYQDSDIFLQALRRGDGKITQDSDELLSALYRQILQERPDALIVTGDLTFNGEKKSHIALAEWFQTVVDAGVPVWVIPGNHDINVPSPIGYAKGMYYGVEAVTAEEFGEIYADFLGAGEAGFSYVAPVSGDMQVAMTDVAWYREQAEAFGAFTADHAAWLEKALGQAREAGVCILTATHHSLLPHTDFSLENFLMFGHESMAALNGKYHVPLNLSGHLHIQHIAREEGLADAALGAFCSWPHRYALVTLNDQKELRYEAKSLDAAYLPEGFLQESMAWFAGITRDKTKAALTGSPEETERMADYAARFNLAYFSGTYCRDDPAWTEDAAWGLWAAQKDSSFWHYMNRVMIEPAGDNLVWEE